MHVLDNPFHYNGVVCNSFFSSKICIIIAIISLQNLEYNIDARVCETGSRL